MEGIIGLIDVLSGARDVLIGVVVGTLLVWGGEWWRERRSRSKSAYYLAVRITLVLDVFVGACIDAISPGAGEGKPHLNPLPDAPSFPTDVDWKSIDKKLMHDILSIPNNVIVINKELRAVERSVGLDYFDLLGDRLEEYAELGLEVLKIVKQMRNKYGVPEQSTTTCGEGMFMGIIEMAEVARTRRGQDGVQS